MALVERAIKRAADRISSIECSQCLDMFSAKLGVRVLKEQPLAGGDSCALIQLSATVRFGAV